MLSIVAAGMLAFTAYAIVLSVLQFSKVSYVSHVREFGIVFSVLLGAIVLKESLGKGRILGSIVITFGVFLIAIG